jgi:hypothetical protein
VTLTVRTFREGDLEIARRSDGTLEAIRKGDEWLEFRASDRPLRETPPDQVMRIRAVGKLAIERLIAAATEAMARRRARAAT